jgi:hypothetical protein
MAQRQLGNFNFSANYEVKKQAPLDARLTTPEHVQLSSLPFAYEGMIVAVTGDTTPSLNGAYLKTGPGVSEWTKFGVGDVPNFTQGDYIIIDTTTTPGESIIKADATDSWTDATTDKDKLVARDNNGFAYAETATSAPNNNDNTLATTAFVQSVLSSATTLVGGFNANTGDLDSPLTTNLYTNTSVTAGDYYVVTAAGNFFNDPSVPLTPGDSVIVQTTANPAVQGNFLVVEVSTGLADLTTPGIGNIDNNGTGIGVSYSNGTATLTNTDQGSDQFIFKTITVPTQTSILATSNTSTLNIEGAGNITLTTSGNTLTIDGSAAANGVTTSAAGTNNVLPIFTGAQTIGDSTIIFDGQNPGEYSTTADFSVVGLTAERATIGTTSSNLLLFNATSNFVSEAIFEDNIIFGDQNGINAALNYTASEGLNLYAGLNNAPPSLSNLKLTLNGDGGRLFGDLQVDGAFLDSNASPGVAGYVLEATGDDGSGNATGTSWQQITGGGTVTGTGQATRVAFWDSTSSLSSSADLYWDNPNGRLGIGNSVPLGTLDVSYGGGGSGAVDIGDVVNIRALAPNIYFQDNSAGTENYAIHLNQNKFTIGEYSGTTLANNIVINDEKVGINEGAPTQELHVSGNVRVTNAFYDSNNSPGQDTYVLTSTGNGTGTAWAAASSGSIGGSGTENQIPKFSAGGTSIEDSIISESSGATFDTVDIAGYLDVNGDLAVTQRAYCQQQTLANDIPTTLTTKGYVDGLAAGGVTFKGTFNAATGEILSGGQEGEYLYGDPGPIPQQVEVFVGDFYLVATGGDFYGAGITLSVGDSIIGVTAAPANSSTEANWSIVQSEEGVTALTSSTSSTDSTGNAITTNTDATGSVTIESFPYSGTTNVGHVPTGGDATTFLRGDGTWVDPNAGVVKNITTGGGLDDSTSGSTQNIFLKNNTTFTDGQILKWNSTDSQLENSAMSQDSQSNIAVSGSIKAKGGEFTDDVKLVDSQGDPGIPDGLSSAVNKKYVQNLTSNFVSGTTAGSPNTAVTEIRTLTQAQYDALTPSASVMYVIIG